MKNIYINRGDTVQIHVLPDYYCSTKKGWNEYMDDKILHQPNTIIMKAFDNETISFDRIHRPTVNLTNGAGDIVETVLWSV